MNYIDLFILALIGWCGLWGYLKGFLSSLVAFIGGVLSLFITSQLYQPTAMALSGEVKDVVRFGEDLSQRVDLTYLTEAGVEEGTVLTWYFGGDQGENIVPVKSLSTGELSHVIEANVSDIMLFLTVHAVCFILSYTICMMLVKIFSEAVYERTVKQKRDVAMSWPGAFLGVSLGLLMSGVVIMLILMISPIAFSEFLVTEVKNSHLSYALVRMISTRI